MQEFAVSVPFADFLVDSPSPERGSFPSTARKPDFRASHSRRRTPVRSKIVCKSLLLLVAILALACATWAQSVDAVELPASKTLTITLKGLLGPILTGSDPL